MPGPRDFFTELDAAWPTPAGTPFALRIIGSTALMLMHDYQRGTKDTDILRTLDLTSEISSRLVDLGGRASPLSRRHRMFLEIVPSGFPFLPRAPRWHRVDIPTLRVFEVHALDVVDVVVAKLARLNDSDLGDIEAMIERELVPLPSWV